MVDLDSLDLEESRGGRSLACFDWRGRTAMLSETGLEEVLPPSLTGRFTADGAALSIGKVECCQKSCSVLTEKPERQNGAEVKRLGHTHSFLFKTILPGRAQFRSER